MVITERVKNKIFNTHMDSKLLNSKIEYEAIAFIQYVFGDRFGKLNHLDAPDIQNTTHDWGIEVVRVVTTNDGMLGGEINRYLNAVEEHNVVEQNKYANKIKRDGGKVLGNGVMFSLQSSLKEKNIFQLALKQKLEKLPIYRRKGFAHMGIYMLYDSVISFGNAAERKEWLTEIQSKYQDKYDIAIVVYRNDTNWSISFYDFITGEILNQEIDNEICNYIGILGRMTAEGEIKPEDPEWL